MSQNISINNVAAANFDEAFQPMQSGYISKGVANNDPSFATNINPAALVPAQRAYVSGVSPLDILQAAYIALPTRVRDGQGVSLQVKLQDDGDIAITNALGNTCYSFVQALLPGTPCGHGEMIVPLNARIWFGYQQTAYVLMARVTGRVTEEREQTDIDLLCRDARGNLLRICVAFWQDCYWDDRDESYNESPSWETSYQCVGGQTCLLSNEWANADAVVRILFPDTEE